MHRRIVRAALGLAAGIVLTVAGLASADEALKDVVGGKDHPVISRYAGSALVGYAQLSFEQAVFPLTSEVRDKKFVKSETVEGRITRLAYLAPAGATVLEVHRNYQDALAKAGFVKKFACDRDDCNRSSRIQAPFIDYASTMKQVKSYGGYSDIGFLVLNTDSDLHYTWGTLRSGGRDVYVGVFTSKLAASDSSPLNNRAGTFIEIVEPRAMETGKVSVDAGAMQKGLAAEGKVAIYGVYFDTGKADVKPESKPQLDEMAKLLTTDKTLRVVIVGHTDNQGTIDGNVALSQKRAESIVAALVKDYRIDGRRLLAKGVASFAPVASNDAEEGRAKNRRVELVKQ